MEWNVIDLRKKQTSIEHRFPHDDEMPFYNWIAPYYMPSA